MLTIPLRIPSTSASEASLKETSHTLIIFCKSSSNQSHSSPPRSRHPDLSSRRAAPP